MNSLYKSGVLIFLVVVALGLGGCAKRGGKADQPYGRSGVEGAAGSADPNMRPVYFAYDSFEVGSDMRGQLKDTAKYISGHQSMKVQIEGHCDERGSNEYNLALGDRRANAVQKYLVGMGVPADGLLTISYGEERPASEGSDEEAWGLNRRAMFLVVSK